VRKTLWKDTFESPRFRDAEIVVVVVGYHDHEVKALRDPECTRKNIQRIVSGLIELEKIVYVCGAAEVRPDAARRAAAASGGADGGGAGDGSAPLWNRERNRLVREYVTMCRGVGLPLHAGPQLNLMTAPRLRGFDGVHLSPLGYAQLASKLAQCLQNSVTKVEFTTWKKDIFPDLAILEKLEALHRKEQEATAAKEAAAKKRR
jgi:hypothetical protein